MSAATTPFEAGSQRERTTLAWNRTAIALVGNGVLVVVRHDRAFPAAVSGVLAGLFVVTSVLTVVHAVHRRRLDLGSDERVQPATAVVVALGVTLTVLCALTLVTLVALAA